MHSPKHIDTHTLCINKKLMCIYISMHSPKHTDIYIHYVQIKILDVHLYKVYIVQNTQIYIYYGQ